MHLIRVGHMSPHDVLAALETHDARFGDKTWRQSTPGSAHADTESIYLRMPPVIDFKSVFHSKEVQDEPMMAEPAFRRAVLQLGITVGGEVARAMIVRLKPKGIIMPHVDEGEYSEATERYHWVIQTNPDCYMQAGGDSVHMDTGEIWFFDKHAKHSVLNGGNTPRIHLIFDAWAE